MQQFLQISKNKIPQLVRDFPSQWGKISQTCATKLWNCTYYAQQT